MSIDNLFLWLGSLSPIRYKATKCGHRTKRCGSVSAYGHTITTKMKKNDTGSIDYCLDCIGKMAIKCTWCGDPIFVGDPVTLYTPVDRDFDIPKHAIVYNKEPLQLVGCLSRDCADTGADRAGFWLPDDDVKGHGHVQRVQTAYEAILGAERLTISRWVK